MDEIKLKEILFDILDEYEEYEDIVDTLRNIESEKMISEEEYDFIMENYDNWLEEYEEKKETLEEKKLTKEEIKDLLYQIQNEFDNELDFDFDYNGRELTQDDLDMLSYYLDCFVNKMYSIIDDYVVDDELED